jgi:RNA polymerase sigma-70 factor, ECF subfamily
MVDREADRATFAATPEWLCDTYAGRVYKFAQLVSNDASGAEDLAQDALERAIRGLRTFDPSRGEVEAWLWRIVVNAARDAGRIARRRRLAFEVLADRFAIEHPADAFAEQLDAGDVLAAVRALPARHQAAIALRFGADLSYREVGRALGISEAAAQMITRRALASLRHRLTGGTPAR